MASEEPPPPSPKAAPLASLDACRGLTMPLAFTVPNWGGRNRLPRGHPWPWPLAGRRSAGCAPRAEHVPANDGWAAPINDRPLQLVLVPESGEAPLRLQIGADARDWYAGEEHAVRFALPSPGGAAPGACEVRLAFPDPSERLAAEPRYHVRLANAAMPVTGGGEHDLGLTVWVIAASQANDPLSE